jgi:hypothetical protein
MMRSMLKGSIINSACSRLRSRFLEIVLNTAQYVRTQCDRVEDAVWDVLGAPRPRKGT